MPLSLPMSNCTQPWQVKLSYHHVKSILSVTSEGGRKKECNKEIKIKVQNNKRKKKGKKSGGVLQKMTGSFRLPKCDAAV